MYSSLRFYRLILTCCIVCTHVCAASICDITSYGAVGNGSSGTDTINCAAFKAAIRDCGVHGGVVIVPKGRFLTAPFNLTSNIVLKVLGTILGTTNRNLIPKMTTLPSYGVGMTYAPLIGACNASNITITGNGTIDGQGGHWWNNPQVANGPGLPKLIEVRFVDGMYINGVVLLNSPFWNIHPWASKNIHIHDINITADQSSQRAWHTDGINPDSCENVLIEDYWYCGGDDAIAVKSGWNWFGIHFGMPSKNITVQRAYSGCRGGFTIGSEMSGGVENVTFIDSVSTGESGIRISSELGRGGYVRNILFKNLTFSWKILEKKTFLFHVNQDYNPDNPNKTLSYFSNISFDDIIVTSAPKYLSVGDVTCLDQTPCYNISFNNVQLLNVSSPRSLSCKNVHGSQTDVNSSVIPTSCTNSSY